MGYRMSEEAYARPSWATPQWLNRGRSIGTDLWRPGMEIGQGAAEEQRAILGQAARERAQFLREQGEREGRFLTGTLESGMKGYQAVQQDMQAKESMRLAEVQRAIKEAELADMPEKQKRERALGDAQIALAQAQAKQAGIASDYTRSQLERQARREETEIGQQEIALSVARANRDISQAQATDLGLPGAYGNETVAMYQLRKESEGDVAALEHLNAQKANIIASTETSLAKAPHEIKNILAQTDYTRSSSLLNQYNAKMSNLQLNSATRDENVKRLSSELRPWVQDPNGFALKQKQLVDSGVPPNEVIEAAAMARSAATGEDLQKALIDQASPMFQYKAESIKQSIEYNRDMKMLTQAASKLMTIGERVGNRQIRDTQEMQQAKQILIEAFDRHGMTKYSDALRAPVTTGAYGLPRSDKAIADEGINMLAQRMRASMLSSKPGTLGDVGDMTQVQRLLQETEAILAQYGWKTNYENMQGQENNYFGGINNVNFQNLGGQP